MVIAIPWTNIPISLIVSFFLVLLLIHLLSIRIGQHQFQGITCASSTPSCRPVMQTPPGPRSWPVVGNLPLLALHRNPWHGFEALRRIYGNVFSLTLGVRRCVVVSSANTVREVLVTKAADFGGRPDFHRYNVLFGGDRENSLALCEWTHLQKLRRNLAHAHLLPRAGSSASLRLQDAIRNELCHFFDMLEKLNDQCVPIKMLLLKMAANVFFKYLCSCRFSYEDDAFHDIVRSYDVVFYDINQCYLVDFLPWLSAIHQRYFSSLTNYAGSIRQFIEKEVILKRQESPRDTNEIKDIVDMFLHHLEEGSHPEFKYDTAIFELEDLLGGSSGVANLCMRALGHIAQCPEVQEQIRSEAMGVLEARGDRNGLVLLEDRHQMPYTEATVLETLRVTSSPIVPHVATVDTDVCGWSIKKGTIVIFNNYHLNFGEELWTNSEKFDPRRFLSPDGRISKPDYFFPFSTGRRSCLGYKMVQSITFLTLANLFCQFSLQLPSKEEKIFKSLRFGCLALPTDTFSVVCTKQ